VVVLGPPWLGNAVANGGRTLVVVEAATRPTALRAQRRARKEQRPLDVAIAAGELPFRRGSLSAIVVENVAGLPAADAARWLEALVPCLRPGGRLIAADATASTDAAARVSGCFLSVSLTNIVQEWPREGALLTIGASPPPAVVMARLGFVNTDFRL
jgi:SAM-dependent methyltransferase